MKTKTKLKNDSQICLEFEDSYQTLGIGTDSIVYNSNNQEKHEPNYAGSTLPILCDPLPASIEEKPDKKSPKIFKPREWQGEFRVPIFYLDSKNIPGRRKFL
jgi:hypothetical protein